MPSDFKRGMSHLSRAAIRWRRKRNDHQDNKKGAMLHESTKKLKDPIEWTKMERGRSTLLNFSSPWKINPSCPYGRTIRLVRHSWLKPRRSSCLTQPFMCPLKMDPTTLKTSIHLDRIKKTMTDWDTIAEWQNSRRYYCLRHKVI